jgi:hypothetical protein
MKSRSDLTLLTILELVVLEFVNLSIMAAIVALRALFQRMGVSAAASLYFTDVVGVNTIEEAGMLNDDDVERLCQVTRRPGGTMPNPAAGGPAVIPHPSIPVAMKECEEYEALVLISSLFAMNVHESCSRRTSSDSAFWYPCGGYESQEDYSMIFCSY